MKPRKRSKNTVSEASQVESPDGRKNPEERDPDQAWFWTEKWQRMEREADEDLKAGRYKTFDTMEEFLADLDSDDDD